NVASCEVRFSSTEEADVSEQPTCGKGLAEHSVFPARLGELLAAMGQNLEVHLITLDPADQTTQLERNAYLRLARESRRVADELRALAAEMASYRDLPMGRHDPAALSSPSVVEAFAAFVKLERELLALLETSVERGEQMLAPAART
ncbi:MAG TPA: hypothetical protein VN177_06655, partial [Myxococcales bacterium]|nr:hypothetical protein [Myxococcales bacterium]